MARRSEDLGSDDRAFLTERHLATLTTLLDDGTPHVVAIAFTMDFDTGVASVITTDGSQKVRNVERTARAAVCQVDGRRWLSLEGRACIRRERDVIRDAERRYAGRYRPPRENPDRVVIEITVDRVLGRA